MNNKAEPDSRKELLKETAVDIVKRLRAKAASMHYLQVVVSEIC